MHKFMFQNMPKGFFPEEISLEQGFNLAIVFCSCLINKVPDLYKSKQVSDLHSHFMLNRSILTSRWDLVVRQVTSQEQPNCIRKESLFSCLIALIKCLNIKCNSQLKPLVLFLEKMRIYPTKWHIENGLWRKVVSRSHRRLVFPYAVFSTEKKISIEHGFNVGMLFLEDLLELTIMFDLKNHWIAHRYAIKDLGYVKEWRHAVFQVTNDVNPYLIPIKALFSVLIEFAKAMSAYFPLKQDYLLDLLEAMQKSPNRFLSEVKLWERVIKDSYATRSLHIESFM